MINVYFVSILIKVAAWPRGRVLGGSSNINAMQHVRGHPSDYELWVDEFGADGWRFEDVLPYFKKSEDASDLQHIDKDFHGYSGRWHVEQPRRMGFHGPYLQAIEELGYELGDYNGENQLRFHDSQVTVSKGVRTSLSQAFLTPDVIQRPNLEIITKAHVTKVIIEAKVTKGVEYVLANVKRKVYCNREVILSAGAIESPHILLLSGVGPTAQLETFGIPAVSNLAVGENLRDHLMVDSPYFLAPPEDVYTLDRVTSTQTWLQYALFKTGLLAHPLGLGVQGFVRTKMQHPNNPAPDIQYHVFGAGVALTSPETPIKMFNYEEQESDHFHSTDHNTSQFIIIPTLLHPQSVGHLTLRSGDPFDHPLIQPNYLQRSEDVQTLVEGIKLMLALNSTRSFRSLGYRVMEKAPLGCRDLVWGSEGFWECFVRHHTLPLYHTVGTCSMGSPLYNTTVVDPQLRVIGIAGLRVVDASVMPSLPSGNINAAVVMIAERAADIIRL